MSGPLPHAPGFAERTFKLLTPEGNREVRLRISAPEPDPEPGGSWRCRVQITGELWAVDQHAYGEDGVQALVLGLEMARVCLRSTPLPGGTTLTWLGEPALGLPVMLPDSPVR